MNKKETAALSVSADGRLGVLLDAKEKQFTLGIPPETAKGNRQRKFNAVDGETLMSISVWDAADIYLSHGCDEDYRFGYTHEELMRASGNL